MNVIREPITHNKNIIIQVLFIRAVIIHWKTLKTPAVIYYLWFRILHFPQTCSQLKMHTVYFIICVCYDDTILEFRNLCYILTIFCGKNWLCDFDRMILKYRILLFCYCFFFCYQNHWNFMIMMCAAYYVSSMSHISMWAVWPY